MCCGPNVDSKLQPTPDGLTNGYWETTCLCQLRSYPIDKQITYSAKCASKLKEAVICPNDSPMWCKTGPHWGYVCVND